VLQALDAFILQENCLLSQDVGGGELTITGKRLKK
jgi:hypothetical protein